MDLDLLNRIEAYCHRYALLTAEDKVVVGVSGGPDSLCLLYLLVAICRNQNLAPPTVAHLNHHLRRPHSDHDANFVQATADLWQLPCFIASRDVAALAKQRNRSIEECGRRLRYAFLWQVANNVGATKIAVGHNADDQAETILMHFLRGSGLTGLRGMLPQIKISDIALDPEDITGLLPSTAPFLIRPLLDTPRREIEAFCRTTKLQPRDDSSNRDTSYFRNRLRHELLPQLEQYNPNIRHLLNRTAKLVAADVELLEQQVERSWPTVVVAEAGHQIDFQRERWLKLPLGLKRATLRRAIEQLQGNLLNIGFEHIENAMEILEKGQSGASATLPGGLVATLRYDTITIGFQQQPDEAGSPIEPRLTPGHSLPVKIPGVTRLPNTDWQLRAEIVPLTPALRERISQAEPWEAFVDADTLSETLSLRTRQPGDRFYPLGMGHSKKVKDFMIDEKISVRFRERIPILAADKAIVWLCGYRLDDRVKITSKSRRTVHFKFEQC